MLRVIILPAARQDIREAAHWYNKKQPRLGKRFISHIRSKVQIIQTDPQVFTVRYNGIRTAVLDVFPFMIHYTIYKEEDLIIISVLHTSRSPETWQERGV